MRAGTRPRADGARCVVAAERAGRIIIHEQRGRCDLVLGRERTAAGCGAAPERTGLKRGASGAAGSERRLKSCASGEERNRC
jgi:hypothetical protein